MAQSLPPGNVVKTKLTISEKRIAPRSVYRTAFEPRCSNASTVDTKISCMLKTICRVGKEDWSGVIFIIVVHLLLLSLYAVVYYALSHSSATSKPQYPSIKATILGVCI